MKISHGLPGKSIRIVSLILCAGLATARAGVNEWTGLGPDGGWILDAKFHPTVPETLFATTPSGLFRSTNNGVSCLHASTDRGTSFSSAAFAENMFRVELSHDGQTAYFGAGTRIWRSQNAGQNLDLINGLAIDPTNPDIGFPHSRDVRVRADSRRTGTADTRRFA